MKGTTKSGVTRIDSKRLLGVRISVGQLVEDSVGVFWRVTRVCGGYACAVPLDGRSRERGWSLDEFLFQFRPLIRVPPVAAGQVWRDWQDGRFWKVREVIRGTVVCQRLGSEVVRWWVKEDFVHYLNRVRLA
jgi:hypothetical protein